MTVCVAPLAGAWIETIYSEEDTETVKVAPLAGAWIETQSIELSIFLSCRAPRGRVD